MYKLKIAKKASDFLSTVPKKELIKIMEVIDKLQENPRPRWVEKLRGIKTGEYFRTSWGKYRIIYSIEDDIMLVTIADVNGRDDAYKKMNRKLR